MKEDNIITINRDGWNLLVRKKHKYSNSSLPNYGFYLDHNENDLKLITDITNSTFLEVGCASGNSLKYLGDKGAKELWGIDISKEQIKKAKSNLSNYNSHLIVSTMEEFNGVPKNYFDYVISIFSIGYTSNLEKTIENIVMSLKEGGIFILSWTHPLFDKLSIENSKVVMKVSYFDELNKEIFKGEDKIKLIQKSVTMSSLLNLLIQKGLTLEEIHEEKTIITKEKVDFVSNFWKDELISMCPTTIILKLKKKG